MSLAELFLQSEIFSTYLMLFIFEGIQLAPVFCCRQEFLIKQDSPLTNSAISIDKLVTRIFSSQLYLLRIQLEIDKIVNLNIQLGQVKGK